MQPKVQVYLDEAGQFRAHESCEMVILVTHPTELSASHVREIIIILQNKYGKKFKAKDVECIDAIRLAALIRSKGWKVIYHRLPPDKEPPISISIAQSLQELQKSSERNSILLHCNQLLPYKGPSSSETEKWLSLLWHLMARRNADKQCMFGTWMLDERSDINTTFVQHLLFLNFLSYTPESEWNELKKIRFTSIDDLYTVCTGRSEQDNCEGLAIVDYCAKFYCQERVGYHVDEGALEGYRLFCKILNTDNHSEAILKPYVDIEYWVENCAQLWEFAKNNGTRETELQFGKHPYKAHVFDWMKNNNFFVDIQ